MYSETSFTLAPEICLEIFLRARESEGAAKRFSLSLLAASRLALSFAKKNFKKNLWDQGGHPCVRDLE